MRNYNKPKKKYKWVRQSLVLSALKKLFVRSPMYDAIKKAARIPYVETNQDGSFSKRSRYQYQCNICKQYFLDEKVYSYNKDGKRSKRKIKQLQVDHIQEVNNPETGFVDFNTWIEREFAGVKIWEPEKNKVEELKGFLQLVCAACHHIKSEANQKIRREVKKLKKENEQP